MILGINDYLCDQDNMISILWNYDSRMKNYIQQLNSILVCCISLCCPVSSFGEAGLAAGRFSGCCNPVYVTASPTGEILTSEKGVPRISCYSPSGEFRSILLDEKTLGGGRDAYEMRILDNDKIVVAGKNSISTYQYDIQLAKASAQASSSSACALCGIDCPLRVGVTI